MICEMRNLECMKNRKQDLAAGPNSPNLICFRLPRESDQILAQRARAAGVCVDELARFYVVEKLNEKHDWIESLPVGDGQGTDVLTCAPSMSIG